MSITSEGWNEVERRAVEHENQLEPWQIDALDMLHNMIQVTTEDRLRGAIVEAVGELEQGHHSAAWQVLRDALKIKGEIR